MSVLVEKDQKKTVKHYKLEADNRGYFLSPLESFNSLSQLVAHYTGSFFSIFSLVELACADTQVMHSLGDDIHPGEVVPVSIATTTYRIAAAQAGRSYVQVIPSCSHSLFRRLRP